MRDIYPELAKLAFYAEALPFGSSDIEQMFSQLRWLQNDMRSNLSLETVESLLILKELGGEEMGPEEIEAYE